MTYLDKFDQATIHTQPLGTITDGTRVTVSDPAYLSDDIGDEGTLDYADNRDAAVNNAALLGGQWEAWAEIADFGPGGLGGDRVVRSGIRLVDAPQATHTTEAEQGVDAGMVGYFIDRPTLTYDETWQPYTPVTGPSQQAWRIERPHGQAWITRSGFGDGVYGVTVLWFHNLVVGIETEFIVNDGDEG